MPDPKRALCRRLLLPLAAALTEATEAAKDHLPPERTQEFLRLAAEARTAYGRAPRPDPDQLEAAVIRHGGLAKAAAEFGITPWRAHYILARHFGPNRAKTGPAANVIRTLVGRIGLERMAKELGGAPSDAALQWANNRGISASVRRAAERLAKRYGLPEW